MPDSDSIPQKSLIDFENDPSRFQKKLLDWSHQNPRPMPWKGEKDPYKIWVSEIILQQTRVNQGWHYFERFVKAFPTVEALASAEEMQVLKYWEGLGYYSRARNLHAAARQIVHDFDGHFPETFHDLKTLKGVGDYTAAAIASFAFNKPHAVLDGNVYRILSRIFGIETIIDLPKARSEFQNLASRLLDEHNPGAFNQAMMDFGAVCCTPAKPACTECPFNDTCRARLENKVSELPKRLEKRARKTRFFFYLKISQNGFSYVCKRESKDIWKGLYEFPVLELENAEDFKLEKLESAFFKQKLPKGARWGETSPEFTQLLTHQKVLARFVELHLPPEIPVGFTKESALKKCIKVSESDLTKKIPLPKLIIGFLQKKI
ncbi:MAG: A/G-specific adenine glycosylase [Saprospiraceae bacterium]